VAVVAFAALWRIKTLAAAARQPIACSDHSDEKDVVATIVDKAAFVDPMIAVRLTMIVVAGALRLATPYRSHDFNQCIIESICLDEYDIRPAITQPEFIVKYGEAVCEVTHGSTGSWGIQGFVGTTFRSCHHNEKISICGRVGKFLPAHIDPDTTAAIYHRWCDITPNILNIFKGLQLPFQYEPLEYELWASSFEPARRDLLLQIARDGADQPTNIASSFIKKEIAVKDTANPIFKDPRFIQGCPPELSARVGPYIRPWVKRFRNSMMPDWTPASFRNGNQIVYTCGMNAEQVGNSFRDSIELVTSTLDVDEEIVFLEDDQSRFDLHLLKGPFYFLHRLYKGHLPRIVAHLLKRKVSRGTTNLGTKYRVPYTMQSGSPDTSLGDTAVNAAMKYSIHGFGRRWISIICGDDSVTITTTGEIRRLGGLDAIVAAYARFGMEIDAKLTSDPLDVEFCSGRFFPCGTSYVLMPKVGRILSKICWDIKARNASNRVAWLRSIADTMCEYGKIDPLMCSLGKMLGEATGVGRRINTKSEFKFYVPGQFTNFPTEFDVATYYDHHYQLCQGDVASLAGIIRSSRVGDHLTDARLAFMAEHDL